MTSLVLGDLILESLTSNVHSSVNALEVCEFNTLMSNM
jgi:hypothetical protein